MLPMAAPYSNIVSMPLKSTGKSIPAKTTMSKIPIIKKIKPKMFDMPKPPEPGLLWTLGRFMVYKKGMGIIPFAPR